MQTSVDMLLLLFKEVNIPQSRQHCLRDFSQYVARGIEQDQLKRGGGAVSGHAHHHLGTYNSTSVRETCEKKPEEDQELLRYSAG
jgi:hypothetical protein